MGIFLPSYSRPSYGYRRSNKPRTPVTLFSYKAEDVWSAAAAATRINGGYLKEATFRYDEDQERSVQVKEANKVLVRQLLEANQGWMEEDVARGAEARAYFAQGGLMKLLEGSANDFETTAISIAQKDVIESAYDLAVLSSLIASAERSAKRDQEAYVKRNLDTKHVGKVGDHFMLRNAEVIAVGNLSDFGKYRVDAKFEGNLFTWWSGKSYAVGSTISAKGKIKGHIRDRATNVAVTQLNYVKEV